MSEFLKIENDKTYFITFTIVDWIDLFTRNDYVDILVNSIKFCQKEKGLKIYAYCIMPSHVHMIAAAEKGSLGDILRDLKGFTSRKLIHEIKENPHESRKTWLLESFDKAALKNAPKQLYQVWQHSNFPVELYSMKFIDQKEKYIHRNPVEAGLVSHPQHYRLSSACMDSPIKVLDIR